MLRRTSGILAALALAACGSASEQVEPTSLASEAGAPQQPAPKPQLGLMTSLPLYWPLDADFFDLASGETELPWQRTLIERRFAIVPLDTLSPIPGLTADAPETDPLEGLQRLAVIQPRGLSPADNVALDDWVRAGGQLLLVLDPMLTGHYELSLGDPRRPNDTALIPPVVARWGLEVTFDDAQPLESLAGLGVPARMAGEISAVSEGRENCELQESAIIAQCAIGDGRVTLIADAALFEHEELATLRPGDTGNRMRFLLRAAFPES